MNRKTMRKFVPVKNENGKVNLERRATPLPPGPLIDVGLCSVCRKPLMVATGQHIRFHKECRKEGRQRFGRAKNTVEVIEHGIVKRHS